MLSDSFEADLRTSLQVQADLLRRITRTTEGVERDFAESRIAPGEISAMEHALAELEAEAKFLEAEDLADFDPEEMPRIYERHRAAISSELVRIGYRNWDDFVRQTRTFAVSNGLEPLAPFDTLLDEKDFERLKNESYESSLHWDRLDYFFVYGSGMLAALADFLLVRIPKTIQFGEYEGQKGSPLTEWAKKYNTNRGESEGRFADWARQLEKRCKTSYDAQDAVSTRSWSISLAWAADPTDSSRSGTIPYSASSLASSTFSGAPSRVSPTIILPASTVWSGERCTVPSRCMA